MDAILSVWTPDQLTNVLQRMDSFAYAANPIGGLPVVESSVGTAAVPRGQRCVLFDGVDDFATRGARLTSGSPTQLTVTGWIRTTDASGTICGEFSLADRGWLLLVANAGRLVFNMATGATSSVEYETVATITNGTRMHFAVVYNAGSVAIYLNGVAVAIAGSNAPTSLRSTSANFEVGAYAAGTSTQYAGTLDDLRIYSVAKSASEIAAIFNQASTPTTLDRTGLLAAWWLNEESGTTHYDWSGNGRNLTATSITQSTYHATDSGVRYNAANELGYTLSGAVVIPRNEAVPSQDAAGGSLQFAGPIKLNATMEVPLITFAGTDQATCTSFSLGTTYTLAVWVSATSELFFGNNANNGYGFYFTGGSIWHNTGSAFVNTPYSPPDGLKHITVVRNGTSVKFFANGVQIGTTLTLSNNNAANLATLVGYPDGTFRPTGQVGDARVYSVAKSDSEVAAIANGFDDRIGLAARWACQDGPGTSNTNRTLHDDSGNGRTMTVIGGTVASQWVNRTNRIADHCLLYGGSIAANGAFVPGRVGSNLDAAGNAKGIVAGTHGNPYSRFVPNFWSAPSLVNIGSTASDLYAPSGMVGVQAESTADTRYANQARYLAVRSALTGSDKTNAQGWVA